MTHTGTPRRSCSTGSRTSPRRSTTSTASSVEAHLLACADCRADRGRGRPTRRARRALGRASPTASTSPGRAPSSGSCAGSASATVGPPRRRDAVAAAVAGLLAVVGRHRRRRGRRPPSRRRRPVPRARAARPARRRRRRLRPGTDPAGEAGAGHADARRRLGAAARRRGARDHVRRARRRRAGLARPRSPRRGVGAARARRSALAAPRARHLDAPSRPRRRLAAAVGSSLLWSCAGIRDRDAASPTSGAVRSAGQLASLAVAVAAAAVLACAAATASRPWRPSDDRDATARSPGSRSASARRSRSTASTSTLGPGVTGLLGPTAPARPRCCASSRPCSPPTPGSVEVLGQDPATADGRLAIRRRLGYLPQEPGFHRSFSAFDFVDYVAILKEWADRQAPSRRGPAGARPRRPRRRHAQAHPAALRRDAPPGRHRPGAARIARPARARRADGRTRPRAAAAVPRAARHARPTGATVCCRPTRPTTSPRCASASSCSSAARCASTARPASSPPLAAGRVWMADERDPRRRPGLGHRRGPGPPRRRAAAGRRSREPDRRGRLPHAHGRPRSHRRGGLVSAVTRNLCGVPPASCTDGCVLGRHIPISEECGDAASLPSAHLTRRRHHERSWTRR